MPDKTGVNEMERLFQALGDRTRLRLLNLMADQEVCVCYFVEVLDAPQPTISRHLAYLRRSGLVSARREGKWMHYRITALKNPHALQVLTDTLGWLSADTDMQRDRARMARVCCTPDKYVRLQGAPLPVPTARSVDQ